MKYYIIAGEASGDLHASNLIKELKARDGQAEIRAWGGDLMRNSKTLPRTGLYGFRRSAGKPAHYPG